MAAPYMPTYGDYRGGANAYNALLLAWPVRVPAGYPTCVASTQAFVLRPEACQHTTCTLQAVGMQVGSAYRC
jgi:hypothetical protein